MRSGWGFDYRLDWIVSFVAVAEHQGFSAAAAALYRSQPRVSVQVAELENALGVRLFDRSRHPARLTPQGRELLPHAQAMLANLQSMRSAAARADDVARGEVRIGIYPSAAAFLLPPVLTALRRSHPEVSLGLVEGSSPELESALVDGRIDLAVRPVLPMMRSERLAHDLLWREPLVAVVPQDHSLAGQRSVTLTELAEQPLIIIGANGRTDQPQFEAATAFGRAGLEPRVLVRTSQAQTLVALVGGGLGIGIANALAMATSKLDGVRTLLIRDAPSERQVHLWWRSDRAETTAQRAVRELINSVPAPQLDLPMHLTAEPERIAG